MTESRAYRHWPLAILFGIGFLVLLSIMNNSEPFVRAGDEEYALIEKIQKAESPRERAQLIAELEQTPVRIYDFNSRWMLINDVFAGECWSDDHYDSARSDLPRDVQLLWATSYGTSDIENGGFHQFFGNSTGVFAPEMVEWFERSGLHESAAALKDAMAVFGDQYPRSQEERNRFLEAIPGETREEWDPFRSMDDRFFESLPYEGRVFEKAADRWLREVCHITSLHDMVE